MSTTTQPMTRSAVLAVLFAAVLAGGAAAQAGDEEAQKLLDWIAQQDRG